MAAIHRKDYIYAYLTAVFIYTVTAVFSVGYEQASEHFHIIEFALFKMGINQPAELDGLFTAHIQSGFQPFLAYLSLNAFQFLGIQNPFTQIAIIRIFMGLFCLAASLLGVKALLPSIKEETLHIPLIILTPLLWFLPFISVRFSPETLSGSLFLLAFSLVLFRRNPLSSSFIYKIPWVIPGVIMGLAADSFSLTAIVVLSFVLWLVFYGKEKGAHIALLITGIAAGLAIGTAASYWLYGDVCFPFLNNFTHLLYSPVPERSITPWYYWLLEIFMSSGFIVGIVVLLCLFSFWIWHIKNPVTWITMPFLAFCVFLPDVKICTLFPLAFYIPYIIVYSAQDLLIFTEKYLGPRISSFGFHTITILFLLANSLFVFLFTFKPADPDTATIRFVDQQYNAEDIIFLYADNSNPYETREPEKVRKKFYWPGNLEMFHLSQPGEVEAFYSRRDKMILLCVRKSALDAGFKADPEKFTKVFESLPTEYFMLTSNYWEKDYEALVIYQYHNCKLVY